MVSGLNLGSKGFTFSSSAAGTARVVIRRVLPGRRLGTRCVAPRRALRKKPKCKRYGNPVAITRNVAVGPSTIGFNGRIGQRRLAPGRYRATLTVAGAGGTSSVVRLSFRLGR